MATDVSPFSDTAKPPRRKRWVAMSLKMFVALVTILAVGSAWEGMRIYQTQIAIRHFESLGASVVTGPGGAGWFYDKLGPDHAKLLDVVESVSLSNTPCTDADLTFIERLRDVQRLSLGGQFKGGIGDGLPLIFIPLEWKFGPAPPITDAGMASLHGLSSLRSLNLNRLPISDVGLAEIATLVNLERLDLSYTRVSDVGLAGLQKLTSLRALNLRGTKVTGAGLVNLRPLAELEHLDLRVTSVDDEGLGYLADLTRLKELGLEETQVTGAAVAELERTLPRLIVVK